VYSSAWKQNTGAGSMTTFFIKANGIHDCDYQVGGHQPRGHDTLAQFYMHYKVLKSSVTFTVSPATEYFVSGYDAGLSVTHYEGSNRSAINVNLGLDRDYTEPPVESGDLTSINETNGSKFIIVNQNSTPQTISMDYSPRNFWGPASDAKAIGASFGNDPASVAKFRLTTCGVDNNQDPVTLLVQCHVKFWVECTERKDQPVS